MGLGQVNPPHTAAPLAAPAPPASLHLQSFARIVTLLARSTRERERAIQRARHAKGGQFFYPIKPRPRACSEFSPIVSIRFSSFPCTPRAATPSPSLPASSDELKSKMTTSRRLADRKTAKFQKNITRRGSVPETTAAKKGNDYPVGPIVLGFFIFVVIGSSLFQIIRTATSGGLA